MKLPFFGKVFGMQCCDNCWDFPVCASHEKCCTRCRYFDNNKCNLKLGKYDKLEDGILENPDEELKL